MKLNCFVCFLNIYFVLFLKFQKDSKTKKRGEKRRVDRVRGGERAGETLHDKTLEARQ